MFMINLANLEINYQNLSLSLSCIFFFFLIICNNIKPNKENKEGNPPYKQTLKL